MVAFASRHDKHIGKHYVIPIVGGLMNLAMLFAVSTSGWSARPRSSTTTSRRWAPTCVWIIIGVVWVMLNPKMRGSKLIDANVPKRDVADAAPASV